MQLDMGGSFTKVLRATFAFKFWYKKVPWTREPPDSDASRGVSTIWFVMVQPTNGDQKVSQAHDPAHALMARSFWLDWGLCRLKSSLRTTIE